MKLRTIRYSGLPVAPENLKAYDTEFKIGYDKIIEQHGQDMLEVHRNVELLDRQLNEKYNTIEVSAIPKSNKAWKSLLEVYEAPLMIAQSKDNPAEIVLVIMDAPLL